MHIAIMGRDNSQEYYDMKARNYDLSEDVEAFDDVSCSRTSMRLYNVYE